MKETEGCIEGCHEGKSVDTNSGFRHRAVW
jgi:hypothetical protein